MKGRGYLRTLTEDSRLKSIEYCFNVYSSHNFLGNDALSLGLSPIDALVLYWPLSRSGAA